MPWRKMLFKGTEVLARCEAGGGLTAEGGRVEIRYRSNDKRAYHASLRNLSPHTSAEVLPDDHCAEAEPAAPRKPKARKPARGGKPAPSEPAEHDPEAIVAYTDGACSGNPGPAGVGLLVIDGERVTERSVYLGQATNNIAELTAIELALDAVGETRRAVRIHTDSQYSIGVLTKGWKAKANVELIKRIRAKLARLPDVRLIHVRGHAGVPLNERVDELAVQAVKTRTST